MNRETVRVGLTDAILALKASFDPTMTLELPNQVEIDPSKELEPFMKVRIVYSDGWQASLSTTRHHRGIGYLVLEAWVNAGRGLKPANDMLEHFYKGLHMTDSIPGVRTEGARFATSFTRPGWDVSPVMIPFWFDDFSA